jgi:hypothetical protein
VVAQHVAELLAAAKTDAAIATWLPANHTIVTGAIAGPRSPPAVLW